MRRLGLTIDVVSVLVFVYIGRAAHAHGESLPGIASTAWPFLTGTAVGWAVLVARHRHGASVSEGVTVWLSTVTVGMGLRVVAGQGIAFAFVIVALCFLGLTMLGGRTAARVARRWATPGGAV